MEVDATNMTSKDRYEYPNPTELDSISGNYFVVPASIILDTGINDKRVTIFSFFSTRRGLDCCLSFTVNTIIRWLGKKPNRNTNGINNKIIQTISYLSQNKYLTLYDDLISASYEVDAMFNLSKVTEECNRERFAVIYLDELKKILSYQNPNTKDTYLNSDIILLVFAYLRMKIYRRRNELLPEEFNLNNKNSHDYDIKSRKRISPDAYNCFYLDMAKELGISARAVSKAVDILNNIGFIYSEALPRIKYNDGEKEKWRTDHTIFCNTYKREGNYLLADGEDYYLTEIENKKKKLNIFDKRSSNKFIK